LLAFVDHGPAGAGGEVLAGSLRPGNANATPPQAGGTPGAADHITVNRHGVSGHSSPWGRWSPCQKAVVSSTRRSCGSGRCGWVAEVRAGHGSEWEAMRSVATKLGVGSTETVRKWVRRAEVMSAPRPSALWLPAR